MKSRVLFWGVAFLLAAAYPAAAQPPAGQSVAVEQPAPAEEVEAIEELEAAGVAPAGQDTAEAAPREAVIPAPRWSQEVLDLFATIPVQDGGRVKPLDTLAQFTLLRMNGRRSFETPEGEKLDSLEWFLNCLFYPEAARAYPHFIVDDRETITAIGIAAHEERRDRYNYNELLPGRQKLFELAQEYIKIEAKDRTRIQSAIVNLANNMFEFEQITHFFDFAKARFTVQGETALSLAFPEAEGVPYSVALQRAPEVLLLLRNQNHLLTPEMIDNEVRAFSALMEEMERAAIFSQFIALLPPADPEVLEWRTPADLLPLAFDISQPRENTIQIVADLEKLYETRDDEEAFHAALAEYHEHIEALAGARGEYKRVPLEVFFYRWQFIYYSQVLFVFSFLLMALSWLLPRYAGIQVATWIAVAVPTVLLIIGIVLRCIIRERPPVSTLYETLLFITAVAVVLGLIIEAMNRQRIAIAVASFLGMFGMFLAHRYEAKEGVDTMPALIAVLDTNFWLATHVTIITIGYAAGLLAAAIAHVYIFGRLFGFRKSDKPFYRSLNRMIYGSVCFGLLFSAVGTILGGIWANDSWGRFWGWDPKENGALMICLWSLVILHARMGRFIADLGTAICSIILGMIIAFSWWGVNLLGVGLHSYGFTSGVMNMLVLFWLTQSIVVLIGTGLAWHDARGLPPNPPRAKAASPE